jgi:hypothetical protein
MAAIFIEEKGEANMGSGREAIICFWPSISAHSFPFLPQPKPHLSAHAATIHSFKWMMGDRPANFNDLFEQAKRRKREDEAVEDGQNWGNRCGRK